MGVGATGFAVLRLCTVDALLAEMGILVDMGAHEAFAHPEAYAEQCHADCKKCQREEIEFHIFFLLLRCKVSVWLSTGKALGRYFAPMGLELGAGND